MQTRKIQVSFAGGEMSPEIMARTDLDKHSMGLQQCTNWLIKPSGALTYRPGFRVVAGYTSANTGVTASDDRQYSRLFAYKNTKGDDLALRFTINSQSDDYNKIVVTLDDVSTYGDTVPLADLGVDTYTGANPIKLSFQTGSDFETRAYEGAFIETYATNPTYEAYLGTETSRKFFIARNFDIGFSTLTLQNIDGGAVDGSLLSVGAPATVGKVRVATSYPLMQTTFTRSEAVEVIDALSIAQMGDTVYVAHDDYGVYRVVVDIIDGVQSSMLVERVNFATFPAGLVARSVTAAATSGGGSGYFYRYGVAAVSPSGVEGPMVIANDASATNNIVGITNVNITITGASVVVLTKIQFASDVYTDGETVQLAGIYGVVGLNDRAFRVVKRVSGTANVIAYRGGGESNEQRVGWNAPALGAGYYYLVETSGSRTVDWTGTYTTSPSAGTARKAGLQNAFAAGNYNTITWAGNDFCSRYIVYKESRANGVFGYIGAAEKNNFIDDNITPDTTITPKKRENPFNENNNYPAAICAHDRRLFCAGSKNGPRQAWATAIGEPTAFTAGFPPSADDAFAFAGVGLYGRIRHIISLDHLVMLTTREEAVAFASSNGVLSANDTTVRVQSSVGASTVAPVIAGENTIIFCAEAGGHVYGMTRDGDYTFKTNDLSLLAAHLFDGYTIKQVAYTGGDMPVVWCLRSDGVLLGCTFIPSQRVYAWHTHEHAVGEIQSIAALRIDGADELHAMVEYSWSEGADTWVLMRERMRYGEGLHLDGAVRSIANVAYGGERTLRVLPPLAAGGFTISAVSDSADYEATLTALPAIDTYYTDDPVFIDPLLATGLFRMAVVPNADFTGYTGARYTATAQTLPLDTQTISLGDTANIVKAYVRVSTSRGLQVGVSTDDLFEPAPYQVAPYEPTPAQFSGVYEIPLPGDWTSDASIYLVQEYPFPVTITALALDVAKG